MRHSRGSQPAVPSAGASIVYFVREEEIAVILRAQDPFQIALHQPNRASADRLLWRDRLPALLEDFLVMKPFLLNGPIMTAPERREKLLDRMAQDLIRYGALADDREATRVLCNRGYATVDVAILAGEARMLAYQEIVGAEMSKP